jgi:molybdopterin-guanine dinucleotide biosynthesis protein A
MLERAVNLRPRRLPQPVGVVLAGGAGRRLGGEKATVPMGGRPLIAYPLQALHAALAEVVVVAKADTPLPELPHTKIWIEPVEPRHPLTGLLHALRCAGDRGVMVCATDLPFVSPELILRLCRAAARPGAATATAAALACRGGKVQPLLGCYRPGAARVLACVPNPEGPLRDTVGRLAPVRVEVSDERCLFNVNGPADLLLAEAMLATGGRRSAPAQPKVKS